MSIADGTVDYGRVGDASYDAKQNTWHSARACQQASPLQSLGQYRHHIGPSLTEPSQHDDASSIRGLQRRCPEIAGAEGIIASIARDEPFQRSQEVQRAAKGALLDFKHLTDSEANQASLVAFASGERGHKVCIARGRNGREGWQGQYDIALATTHYDETQACYFDPGRGEVQQIAMSDPTRIHELLLAVRYEGALMIAIISTVPFNKDTSKAPMAVYLRDFANSDSFSRSMQSLTDLCFSRNRPFEILTTHGDGSICHWRLSRNRHEAVELCKVFAAQSSPSALSNSVPLVRSVNQRQIAISDNQDLAIRDLEAGTVTVTSLLGTRKVLDMEVLETTRTMLVVLTMTELLWIEVPVPSQEGQISPRKLYSWAHHCDQHDYTLRIASVSMDADQQFGDDVSATMLAILYSRRDSAATQFEYLVSEANHTLSELRVEVLDPIAVSIPFHSSTDRATSSQHLSFFLAPLTSRRTGSIDGRPDSPNPGKNLSFFQAFMLSHNGSLISHILCKPRHGSLEPEPEPLSWSRTLGSRLPLSARVANNSFIVDSDEEDNETKDGSVVDPLWWMRPRLVKFRHQSDDKKERNRNVNQFHDYLRIRMLPDEASLSISLAGLTDTALGNLDDRSTAGLLADMVELQMVPHDLVDASERIQMIVSESTLAGHRGLGSLLCEVPLPTYKHTSSGERMVGSASLRGIFDTLNAFNVDELPEDASRSTRTYIEKTARYLATHTNLATQLVVPSRLEAADGNTLVPKSAVDMQDESSPNQPTAGVIEQCRSALRPYANVNATHDGKETSTGLSRVHGTWQDKFSPSTNTPSLIDLSQHDATLIAPRSEEEQAESQRQLKKVEKQRRRTEQSSQAATQSSQVTESAYHEPPTSQSITTSQPLSRPGFQTSQRSTFASSQGLPSASQGSQLPSPPFTQSQDLGLSQSQQTAVDGFPMPQSSMKRPNNAVPASQNSVGLPMRKRRKAGF